MLRRTWPALALTILGILLATFALNRPDERVEIAIDRASIEPSGVDPETIWVSIEGRAINPRPTYRAPISAKVFIGPKRRMRPDLPPSTPEISMRFDPETGRFRVSHFIELPGGRTSASVRVEIRDQAGRLYSRRVTLAS